MTKRFLHPLQRPSVFGKVTSWEMPEEGGLLKKSPSRHPIHVRMHLPNAVNPKVLNMKINRGHRSTLHSRGRHKGYRTPGGGVAFQPAIENGRPISPSGGNQILPTENAFGAHGP